jgi:hypothetical protein
MTRSLVDFSAQAAVDSEAYAISSNRPKPRTELFARRPSASPTHHLCGVTRSDTLRTTLKKRPLARPTNPLLRIRSRSVPLRRRERSRRAPQVQVPRAPPPGCRPRLYGSGAHSASGSVHARDPASASTAYQRISRSAETDRTHERAVHTARRSPRVIATLHDLRLGEGWGVAELCLDQHGGLGDLFLLVMCRSGLGLPGTRGSPVVRSP